MTAAPSAGFTTLRHTKTDNQNADALAVRIPAQVSVLGFGTLLRRYMLFIIAACVVPPTRAWLGREGSSRGAGPAGPPPSSSSRDPEVVGNPGTLGVVFPQPVSQATDPATVARVDSSNFTGAAVGVQSDVLTAALLRYASPNNLLLFPYAAAGGGGALPAITGVDVNVTGTDESLGLRTDESYTLHTLGSGGSRAYIEAASCFGALRALETLSQLVVFNASMLQYEIAASNVSDAPRFPYRGVMLDSGRAYLHVNSVKAVIATMAYSKLNVLHWHLTDDQSWPVELASAPLLAQRAAFSNLSHSYSHAQLRDVVAYARLRGVRVVPEFDSPAHFSPLFVSYPQFAATFYPPWQPPNTSALCLVDPSNPGLMGFIEGIWAELLSIFPDEAAWIGGDEWWDCYQYAPAVQRWMAAQQPPLNTSQDVYRWYVTRLVGAVNGPALGRRTAMGWADIDDAFPGTYTGNPDVVLAVWTGFFSGDWQADVGGLVARNASVVVSGPFYVSATDRSPTYPHRDWAAMYATDLSNFTGAAPGNLDRVLGGELTVWGDAAQADTQNVWMALSPNLYAVAEAWWSPRAATSGADPSGAAPRMQAHRCRVAQRGVPSNTVFPFGQPYEPWGGQCPYAEWAFTLPL